MWRHVHDIFTRVGANNVTWVWSPNIYYASGSLAKDFRPSFPGKAYVDWIGLDGYLRANGGPTYNLESFRGVYGDSMSAIAGHPDMQAMPVMLAEWAVEEALDGGTRKAAQIRDSLHVQLASYPQIKAQVWFNWNYGGVGDLRIDSSSAALAAFREGINNGYYSTSNQVNVGANGKIIPLP
jgi:beta-mannanase